MKNLTWIAASAVLLTLLPSASPSASPAAGRAAGPKVVRSKPGTPVEIDGVPCAAGYVFHFEPTWLATGSRWTRTASPSPRGDGGIVLAVLRPGPARHRKGAT